MDETSSKGLTLTGTNLLTVALISIAVILFSVAVAGVKIVQERFTGLNGTLQQTEYTTYDNGTLSGSQVLNAVRQYMGQDEFGISVQTGKGGSITYGNEFNHTTGEITSGSKNTNLLTAQQQSDPNYINPSGKFTSRVVYDRNGVVRGLIFSQKTP